MIQIRTATTAEDISICAKAILAFRPMLDEKDLIKRSLRMMAESFKLIYIVDENKNEAAAILGYREYEMYRTGRIFYIDDLFTFTDHRAKGYAGALLDYVHELAKKSGIQAVHLDSGYHLFPAHRLYLNKGYVLACHHFARTIEQ